ncbi:glycosyltransferase [Bradyrhizobium sp. NP1]|uniref:glycosyltransferase family 2 protein n=1 Tax=Bradyrhizobium sp. NP1 TaxID=3049772 RepID=UPI0025A6355A|nr:glycosyltransferase [Bradyrhizobium sp. NP1]WJR79499.1 glycosyltransferase [Bradyrhizobium sp. NP1]
MDSSDFSVKPPRVAVAMTRSLGRSIEAVVCVPTFRRPQHLELTLQSLAQQRTTRRFAVVVVENDAVAREGAGVAAAFLDQSGLAGLCLIEPRQGNCHAINAAFEAAREAFPEASHFLMIDDDEIASADWLERMVRAAEATGAEVVGGPVVPRFTDDARPELQGHPAFHPAYAVSGPVPLIYGSGNCLIARRVFERLDEPAFDLRFNFLGGGDLDFFTRCRRSGIRFYWEAAATITETVPASRVRSDWLALRGLRIGAINYLVEFKAARTVWLRARLLAKMLALFPLSLFRAVRLYFKQRQPLIALHPIIIAVGGALASVGIEPQPYKAAKGSS